MSLGRCAFAAVVLACGVTLGAACGSAAGTFAPTGYAHPSYPYSVGYVDSVKQSLMPDAWQLDNFVVLSGKRENKRGADYEGMVYLDVDGDGTRDEVGTRPIYDLLFLHSKTSAEIWVRTIAIDPRDRDKDLRVLMGTIKDGMAGGGYRVVQLEGKLRSTNNDRRYATKYMVAAPAKLAGREAFFATIDIANVDQVKLDPSHIEARMSLVLARTDFEFDGPPVHAEGLPGGRKFPVVLMLGCVSSPADFAACGEDFTGLLSRVRIADRVGFDSGAGKGAASVQPSVDTATPSAPPPTDAAPAALPSTVSPGTSPSASAPSGSAP